MVDVLSDEELNNKLEQLKIWGVEGDRLATRVEFEDYKETVFFANMVFGIAEKKFHHPEIKVEYGAVEIDLTTHEAGGITEKDLDMAEEIEESIKEMNRS